MTDDIASNFRRQQLYLADELKSPLEDCAEALREADAAVKAAREVKETRAESLVDRMRAQGIRKYRYTDAEGRSWTVRVTSKTKVTIKRASADDDLDDGSETTS